VVVGVEPVEAAREQRLEQRDRAIHLRDLRLLDRSLGFDLLPAALQPSGLLEEGFEIGAGCALGIERNRDLGRAVADSALVRASFYGGDPNWGRIIGAIGSDPVTLDEGHARAFELSGGTWTQMGIDLDGEGLQDNFGWAVAMSTDGARIAVGGPPRKIPVLRTKGLEGLLYPGEPGLPDESAVYSARLSYPERDLGWLPGGEMGVLATFFGLSILSGFALKGLFGVTL